MKKTKKYDSKERIIIMKKVLLLADKIFEEKEKAAETEKMEKSLRQIQNGK